MAKWQIQQAKARFSELVRAARTSGPQTVTVRGEPAVVVLSQQQYRTLRSRADHGSFTALMRSSPLVGVAYEVQRNPSAVRDTTFEACLR